MNKMYASKLELAMDVVAMNDLPEGVTFSGLDQWGKMLFDINIVGQSVSAPALNEIVKECNFVDRLMQGSLHLVRKD